MLAIAATKLRDVPALARGSSADPARQLSKGPEMGRPLPPPFEPK
jgi:hypothetical protein